MAAAPSCQARYQKVSPLDQGSTTAGQPVASYTYDAYGKTTSHTGTATTPLQYTGQYQDTETGLYYLRARYYDPTTAQFLTVDPLTKLTHSPYAYVDNNPLNHTDPTGLSSTATIGLCELACIFLAAAALAAATACIISGACGMLAVAGGSEAAAIALSAIFARAAAIAASAAVAVALSGMLNAVSSGGGCDPCSEPNSGSGATGESVPSLRQAYTDEVAGLANREAAMREAGASSEQIARALHAERRALGVKYKNLTPEDELARIYARNQEKYGDPLGPSIDYLIGRGKSWDDIIDSAMRTGGKDLGY